jgi:hypothetical protein
VHAGSPFWPAAGVRASVRAGRRSRLLVLQGAGVRRAGAPNRVTPWQSVQVVGCRRPALRVHTCTHHPPRRSRYEEYQRQVDLEMTRRALEAGYDSDMDREAAAELLVVTPREVRRAGRAGLRGSEEEEEEEEGKGGKAGFGGGPTCAPCCWPRRRRSTRRRGWLRWRCAAAACGELQGWAGQGRAGELQGCAGGGLRGSAAVPSGLCRACPARCSRQAGWQHEDEWMDAYRERLGPEVRGSAVSLLCARGSAGGRRTDQPGRGLAAVPAPARCPKDPLATRGVPPVTLQRPARRPLACRTATWPREPVRRAGTARAAGCWRASVPRCPRARRRCCSGPSCPWCRPRCPCAAQHAGGQPLAGLAGLPCRPGRRRHSFRMQFTCLPPLRARARFDRVPDIPCAVLI